MNSIGIGGSASTGALLEVEIDGEVAGAELATSDAGFGESLHPNSEKRAIKARSLLNWVNDITP